MEAKQYLDYLLMGFLFAGGWDLMNFIIGRVHG
jgi:hypothetical protein